VSSASTTAAIAFWNQYAAPQRILVSQRETSGLSDVALDCPSSTQPWDHALLGGLRFEIHRQSGYIRGGHLRTITIPSDEVVDIFNEFLRESLPDKRYYYELFRSPFPRIVGWPADPSQGIVRHEEEHPVTGRALPISVAYPSAEFEISDLSSTMSFRMVVNTSTSTAFDYASEVWSSNDAGAKGELETLLASAHDQEFEYGTVSDFDLRLSRTLDKFGQLALDILSALLAEPSRVAKEVALELLRVIGGRESLRETANVRGFLTAFLSHTLPSMRDGAAVALLDLGDRSAIDAIVSAAKAETNPMVRSSLEQAARELSE
jgi:hypothetical protein